MEAFRISDEKAREALISVCIRDFDRFCRNARLTVYCGPPPDRLLLHVGRSKWAGQKLLKRYAAAYLYAGRTLYAEDYERKRCPDRRGVYFEEAYAEASYADNGVVYITMTYSPGYANCCAYDLVDDGRGYLLANRQLMWLA